MYTLMQHPPESIYCAIFGQRKPVDLIREFKIETNEEAEAFVRSARFDAEAQGMDAPEELVDEVVTLTLADLKDGLSEPQDGDLERARSYLGATLVERRGYVWRDDASGLPSCADEDDLRELGASLRVGRPDAYSHWCAEEGPFDADLDDLRARVVEWEVVAWRQWADGEEVPPSEVDWCKPIDIDLDVTLATALDDDLRVEVRGVFCGVMPFNEGTARACGDPASMASLWVGSDAPADVTPPWVGASEVLDLLDARMTWDSIRVDEDDAEGDS